MNEREKETAEPGILSQSQWKTSQPFSFFNAYKVVDEAFILLDISNGGADWDVERELIKVTKATRPDHLRQKWHKEKLTHTHTQANN